MSFDENGYYIPQSPRQGVDKSGTLRGLGHQDEGPRSEPPWDLADQPQWLSWDELKNIPKPEPLVSGVLTRNSLAWLVGDPGTFKTFTALDIALSVSFGIPWQTRPTTATGVAYITGEGVTGLSSRVSSWLAANHLDNPRVKWLPQSMQVFTQGNGDLSWLLDNLHGCGLVVLDTQSRMTVGLNENDSADMGRFVEAVARIRDRTGACVLMPHHSTKAGSLIRGHSIVHGAADTVIAARRLKHEPTIRLKCAKQKEGREFDPIWLRACGAHDSLTMLECEEPQPTGKTGHEWKELTHDE